MTDGVGYRRRTANKVHRCTASGTVHPIAPGEVYVECTEYPGGELGYADYARQPVRMAMCEACARDYDHGDLLSPPTEKDTPR